MSEEQVVAPIFYTEEHKRFLDGLRRSGIVNMFGARPYIEAGFPELTKGQATSVLTHWIETFEGEDEE